jgi:hypothetical protein
MLRLLMHFTIWNWLNNLHIRIFPCKQNIIGLFKLGENLANGISFHIWKQIASGGSVMLKLIPMISAQLADQPMAPFQIPQIYLVPIGKLPHHSGNVVATD